MPPANAASPTCEEVRKRIASGDLVGWLASADETWPEGLFEAAVASFAELDRSGEADSVEILFGPGASWQILTDFQARERVYRRLVAGSATQAHRLIQAIEEVQEKYWHYVLETAFRDWCLAEPSRTVEVLSLLDAGQNVQDRFVVSALLAGYACDAPRWVAEAISMCRGNRSGTRTAGICALGAIPADLGATRETALEALLGIWADGLLEPQIRGLAVWAAFNMISRGPGIGTTKIKAMVAGVAEQPIPQVLQECARALGCHTAAITTEIRLELLKLLILFDLKSPEETNLVGFALHQSLQNGHEQEVIALLQRIIIENPEQDILSGMGSLAHELSSGSRDRLARILTRWFATGDRALCEAARSLIHSGHHPSVVFESKIEDFSWSVWMAPFVARKAIGYLMPHSTAPVSFVVSLLRGADDAVAGELAALLFDPLLINYPLAVRRYLEAVVPVLEGAARVGVEDALTKHAAYVHAIERVGSVTELHPTDRQRRIEYQRHQDAMSDARRKTEGRSPIFSLARRSLLLHGRRSVSYVTDFNGQVRRLDNMLRTVRTEMDHVMGWTYDPFSVEFQLLLYRLERRPA